MRVIAGKYRGFNLRSVAGETVRPTTDRIKEAIFNLIQDEIKNATVLDLFAGTGSLGIESLSRGAKETIFCDNFAESIKVVRANLDKVKEKAEVVVRDYRAALSELAMRGYVFDIIFLDPPYGKHIEDEALQIIADKEILNASGTIILERKRGLPDYSIPLPFAVIDERDYGGSTISIIRKATKIAFTGTFDPFTLGHKYLAEKAADEYDMVYVAILVNPDKKPMFSIEKRMKFIEKSLRSIKKKVKIAFYDGLAIDFCKRNGIQYIIRGVRNNEAMEYEEQMATYNRTHGGITTVIVSAKDSNISSTFVKEKLLAGEDISAYVDRAIIKELMVEGKRWKT
ncbi:MAG: 16S rRNA (guanine(966)-N(2))-methyltransferase RsmD [Christensenellaceae bacterium]|jgi:16S rRNA (guanine(966)-N(2))-methyltransferase RsmD/pantetheine-phosphate adenylyltransferase|nr:16S rRNA (guanine(966)-N(2))-methyltransferase RsmD [Christensenellaceae bacterium]